ncbi:MAG: SDR family oxidoreductase [Pikeienuella sp.]|uniref:SDR family oxidoreductase n=1 Tax=Pikeienuella sp. TaxID=2831957 RepID=UPI00391D7CEA
MNNLDGRRVVVLGGGSGIGRAVAAAAKAAGAEVALASRNRAALSAAAEAIGGAGIFPLDMTDAAAAEPWAASVGAADYLVISASSSAHGPFATLDPAAVAAMFEAKFHGPYRAAKAMLPHLRAGGSVTFFSGVLSRRPSAGTTGLGAVNAAVEGLARGLALELGPKLRVNCLSPGLVRSDAYAGMPEEAREAMFAATAASLPAGRVGAVEDLAAAALFLMANPYATGIVLDVDGGHLVKA